MDANPDDTMPIEDMFVEIWHNPACGTSRNALALIRHVGIEPSIVEYLVDTPDKARLRQAIAHAGLSVRDAIRSKQPEYLGYGLDDVFYARSAPYLDSLRAAFGALTRAQLHEAVARHLSLARAQIAIVAPDAARLAAALVEDAPSPIRYTSEKAPEILREDEHIAAYPLRIGQDQIRIVPVAEIFR